MGIFLLYSLTGTASSTVQRWLALEPNSIITQPAPFCTHTHTYSTWKHHHEEERGRCRNVYGKWVLSLSSFVFAHVRNDAARKTQWQKGEWVVRCLVVCKGRKLSRNTFYFLFRLRERHTKSWNEVGMLYVFVSWQGLFKFIFYFLLAWHVCM